MSIIRNLIPGFYFEYADPAGSGGAATGQGVSDPTGAQPSGQGTGQPTEPTADQFWGLFPTVPEEQRSLLEPHLKNVQGHVTKLEQQYAPFKPFLEAGYTPDQVGGLMNFARSFDADPLQAWMELGQMLQGGDQPLISQDLDFEILAKIARGEELEEDPGQPQMMPEQNGALPPELVQYIQGLEAKVNQLEQGFTQQQNQAREAAQNRLLQQQFGTMRETLKNGGFPDDALTDEALRSALITANGNVQAAIKFLTDQRSAILKSFTNSSGPEDLDLPNGAPPTPPKPTREPRDGFEAARAGATNYLKRQNRAAAQG